MPREIHVRFFIVFGLLLGALFGLAFSLWAPPRTAMLTDLYNPVMWAVAILSFFVLQYGLGVLLNKPSISKEIYFGIFLIPMTYTASMLAISLPNFLHTLVAVEVPALILFITSFYIVSPFVSFFTGFDTKALDDAKIPVDTAFSFDLQPSPAQRGMNLKLLRRIVQGLGLTVSLEDVNESSGLIICRKEKLHLGIVYEFRDQILKAMFVPFEIVNDTVKRVEDADVTLDMKAQIGGILYAWMQNDLILRFNEVLPDINQGFEQVSEGLGPLKTPLTTHIRKTITAFPKNHPYQLALLVTSLVIVANVTLFILGRLVFR